ncbi:DUF397 domain-containing protein [Streptomyces sp. NPDC058280]|uniref:DUF397 domain-containing protein n=1 Tax=Streptomyces sp. NPDC058280 TaxID=3346419 RepID=UPI0036E9FE3E
MSAYLAQPPAQTSAPTPPTPPLSAGPWRRSSRSTGMNNCVETARTGADGLAVRDSKNVTRPHLSFSTAAWTSFVSAFGEEVFGA